MPTAGRLAGAVAFALLGAYFAYAATPFFEDGRVPGFFFPLCVAAGIWAGWVVVGKRAGRGYGAGIGNGITGVVAMTFWILFLFSFKEMIDKSMRRSYDGPVEAVVNVFAIMAEYLFAFAKPELGIILAVGAILGGYFSEFFAQRFP